MKKIPSIKSLQKKAESLWKEYCLLRDGRFCRVRLHYPELKITHSDIYQVDHCISRQNKHTFLEVANGTVICSNCNLAKNNKNKSVDRAINEIVIKREGKEVYERMVELDQSCGANFNWSKRWWLEGQIKILEEMIKGVLLAKSYFKEQEKLNG